MSKKLSPREEEIILLVARGFTNAQIACEIGITEKTVESHLGRIYAKLGARCRAEAVSIYLQLCRTSLSGKSIKGI
ncbi:MAG: response regulator transcription factor, partial [Anaerolineales bacterium]